MATIEFKGIKEYEAQLKALSTRREVVIKMAVYDGAAIVADSVRAGLEWALSVEPENVRRQNGDLAKSLSLIPMQNESGYISTKIDWAGYDRRGIPNALKASVLEGGRSDQPNRPAKGFIRNAVKICKNRAIVAMERTLNREIAKILKEKEN